MPGLVDYVNLPGIIGELVSAQLASLTELGATLGAEDAYDLLEVLQVNRHNDYRMRQCQPP